ncbi:MAG: hypothetical protein LBL82_08070 [Oscillospiraceae bacterium]|nr:hypothetical protein [Oscillospiraceae bacterium]
MNIYSSVKGKDLTESFKYGSDGIGLISTEFLFMEFPDVSYEMQYQILDSMFSQYPNKEFTIRLFDITDDKKPVWFSKNHSNNLYSSRGIDLMLEPINYLRLQHQIEAILDLSKKYNVSILIPFVNNYKVIYAVKDLIEKENKSNRIKVGVMIETVAAALEINEIINIVDFISIGTNDLVQSYFGIDRRNIDDIARVNVNSSSFLEFIKMIYSKSKGTKLRICGQLPIVPNMIEKLVQIGYNDYTVNPYWIPFLRWSINNNNNTNILSDC